MIRNVIVATIALTALALLAARPALAEPMKCSGQEKACIVGCQKNPAFAANCVANCRAQKNYCRRTGGWVNGTSRYCGLMRQ
ncbi:MAG: hypothetical protein ACREB2_10020 [Pseudolabrys sp.]